MDGIPPTPPLATTPPTKTVMTMPVRPDNPVLEASPLKSHLNQNLAFLSKALADYRRLVSSQLALPDKPHPQLVRWLCNLEPVHRVDIGVFMNYVVPDRRLRARNAQDKVRSLSMEEGLKEILLNESGWEPAIKEIIKKHAADVAILVAQKGENSVGLKEAFNQKYNPTELGPKDLHRLVEKFKFVKKLKEKQPGLLMGQDEKLGTTSCVFATLGFNNHAINGGCVIFLQRYLLNHPGTTISPCAATAFFSKRAFYYQPWLLYHLKNHGLSYGAITSKILDVVAMKKETVDFNEITEDIAISCYHNSVFNAGCENWAQVTALQLQYAAQLRYFRNSGGVGYKSGVPPIEYIIQDYYHSINAHGIFEVHLPLEVTVHFFDKVYFEQASFNAENKPKLAADPELFKKLEFYDDPQAKQLEHFNAKINRLDREDPLIGFWATIAHRKGTPYWLPCTFKTPGTGAILFTARGQHIRLTFAESKDAYEKDAKMYLLCIGVDHNQKSYLKLSQKYKEVSPPPPYKKRSECPLAMADHENFSDFWVSINDGILKFGRGNDITQGEVPEMGYRDPLPLKFKYLAISNWSSGIEFRNFRIIGA